MQGIVVSWKCNKRLRGPMCEMQSGQWIFHPHSILVQKAKLLLSGFFTGETWGHAGLNWGDRAICVPALRGSAEQTSPSRRGGLQRPRPPPQGLRRTEAKGVPASPSHGPTTSLQTPAPLITHIYLHKLHSALGRGKTLWRPRILPVPGLERRLESLPHPRRAGHWRPSQKLPGVPLYHGHRQAPPLWGAVPVVP